MRTFIDGENFRHRIVDVLLEAGLIGSSEQPFEFDIRALIDGAVGYPVQEINYYTSHVQVPNFDIPDELRERIESIKRTSQYWTDGLTKRQVQVIEGGNLKVHTSTRCMHCHKTTQVLQEKGVDVRLATDIVLAATLEEMDDIIVASSDTDMLPALDVAKRANTRIIYLHFEDDLNHAIAAMADETTAYTRQHIIDCFNSQNG